jgi:acyl carrier protein
MVSEAVGTIVDANAPLMAAGFDSLSASEFGGTLGIHFSSELPSTLLFDQPTINALSDVLSPKSCIEDLNLGH